MWALKIIKALKTISQRAKIKRERGRERATVVFVVLWSTEGKGGERVQTREREVSLCSLRVAALPVNAVARQRGTCAKRIRNVFAKKNDSKDFGVCLRCWCVAGAGASAEGALRCKTAIYGPPLCANQIGVQWVARELTREQDREIERDREFVCGIASVK